MMPYKFRVWCPNCINEDFDGCFGGGWELSEEIYPTVEEAIKAADDYVKDSVWEWDIVEVDTDNPDEIVKSCDPDILVPYGLPDGKFLRDFDLPPNTRQRVQMRDQLRARFWLKVALGGNAPEPPLPQTITDWKLLKNLSATCIGSTPQYPHLNGDELSCDYKVWVDELVSYTRNNPPLKNMSDAEVLGFVYNLCGLTCEHPLPFRKHLCGGFRCDVCGETIVFEPKTLPKLPRGGRTDA
jgi:hypothetical protein